jgi:hypothetical protein
LTQCYLSVSFVSPIFSSCILFCYSECLDSESSPVPRPPKSTHQRSHSKPFSFPPSATVSTGSPPDGQQLRNSWSESSVEEAPPLPPRGQSESLVYILNPNVQFFCEWFVKSHAFIALFVIVIFDIKLCINYYYQTESIPCSHHEESFHFRLGTLN